MYGKTDCADERPTLIYCRESRDENSEHYERIETQRDILLDFCRRRGLVNIVDIILDDDCTGTDFHRFDSVIRRVRCGEIKVIVFKDASRLGRNLKESLIFEEIMTNCDVEILFESEEYNADFFPLKAWFNEQRAKEDSLKIRRTLRHKMESGTLLVKPSYGYARGKDNTMIPHEETAAVVRLLFEEAAKGRGSGELAAQLNASGVPTPSQVSGGSRTASCWNAQHIRRILTDPVYIGTMIHHKASKKSFKNKRVVRHAPPEWIVLEDHHEALVSKKLFEEVQATRRRFKREKYTMQNRPFSGLLRCGRCGSLLVLRSKKGRPDAYICGKNHREGAIKDDIRPDYGCRSHHVREEYLYDVTLRYLKMLLFDAKVDISGILGRMEECTAMISRRDALEKELQEIRRKTDTLYEDKLSGLIREDLFGRKYRELMEKEGQIQEKLGKIEEKIPKNTLHRQLTDLQPGDIINRLHAQMLNRQTLREVFESIWVYAPGELREEDAIRLGLDEEARKLAFAQGGLIFWEKVQTGAEHRTP